MMPLKHVLTNIDERAKTGDCRHCGGRTQLFFRRGRWCCTRRLVDRPKLHQGRELQHVLTNIDEQARTGICAMCGDVRIYLAQGARARLGQKWACGRRPAERGIGGPPSMHQLSDINEGAQRATCAICGPTQIVWRDFQQGGGRWGCVVTRSTMGRTSYKWKEDFKRAICPFCDKWHRWDRAQGKSCRQRLIERDGNHCAVCREPFTDEKKPRVDHDHHTGKVRGLLCRNCNVALGLLKDERQRVEQLLAYIMKHES